jgi:hypothetical protein
MCTVFVITTSRRESEMSTYNLIIDGELVEVDKLYNGGYLPNIDEGGNRGRDWYLSENNEMSDAALSKHWHDMDAKELVCMIGEERMVDMFSWGQSLDDFIEDLDAAQEFASYDGCESDVQDFEKWLDRECKVGGEFFPIADYLAKLQDLNPDCKSPWIEPEAEGDEGMDKESYSDTQDHESYTVDEDEDDELIDLKDRAKELLEGWQTLVDELGFTPMIAYRHN